VTFSTGFFAMALLDYTKTDFWVAVSFIAFIGLLLYFKVFAMIAQALDNRAADIRRQLDEARRLREEAQAILDDYKRKQRDAEKEAADIIALARRETDNHAREAKASFEEMLKRRTKLAEDKIARAQAQVIDEVRNKAIDVAIAASERIVAQKMTPEKSKSLLDEGLKIVHTKLN